MIKRLELRNFQSHKDTDIELGEKVTLITGSSNQGKTSILRAINWIVNNRPSGLSIIRKGTEECSVKLTMHNCKVIKNRSKKLNAYRLKTRRKDINFEAIGTEVPKEISDLLNIKEINIQSQLAPHFLVLDSPGKIGSYFNSILKLDQVEAIIKYISSKMKMKNIELSSEESKKVEIEKEKNFYASIDIKLLEDQIRKYNNFSSHIEQLNIEVDTLHEQTIDLKEIESQLFDLPDVDFYMKQIKEFVSYIARLEKDTDYLLGLVEEAERYEKQLQNLQHLDITLIDKASEKINLQEQREEVRSQLHFLVNDLEDLEEEGLYILEKQIGIIETQLSTINIIRKIYESLKEEVDFLSFSIDDLQQIEEREKDSYFMTKEVKSQMEELKKKLTFCPSCGQKLTEEAKHKLCGEKV